MVRLRPDASITWARDAPKIVSVKIVSVKTVSVDRETPAGTPRVGRIVAHVATLYAEGAPGGPRPAHHPFPCPGVYRDVSAPRPALDDVRRARARAGRRARFRRRCIVSAQLACRPGAARRLCGEPAFWRIREPAGQCGD